MELISSMHTVRPFNIHHAFITAEAIQRRCDAALLLSSPLSLLTLTLSFFPEITSFTRRSSLAIEFAKQLESVLLISRNRTTMTGR